MIGDETAYDLGKNVDSEELSYFIVEMPPEYTDSENALKQELSSLKKMKRALSELVQIRKEEKSRVVVKTGEKAKEEAMELLRSGAIQIEDKNERHFFKRKPKDLEEEESPLRTPQKPTGKEKQSLYAHFLPGPKLLPQQCESKSLIDDTPLAADLPSATASMKHSSDEFCPPANKPCSAIETAASKRKQQLIALSEEEIDDTSFTSRLSDDGRNDYDRPVQVESVEKGHSFTPNPRSSETTLYVGYHKITTDFVYETFERIGEVLRVKIGEHQNHAYVTMANYDAAQKAIELDHHMINNRLLRVALARRPSGIRSRRPFRPFSPKTRYGRGHSYHAVPPVDSRPDSHEGSRDLITYNDLDYDDN